ncbi:DUF7380 domain-containing protein [Qipengyuania nanhaisediminis]|uniref:DUF7380 domain-containing protein n=1 Tax=Qipengyuania nanhaisediminis TaxID=604088 RepID=A0A1I5MB93_9SPHN|nr:hypothetical protein [Qipengyuania nanhaisediminis]SFP06779.1 hypothetical protein SAMN04488060_1243 [Qipengyuania nanhaisediminis]
MKEAIRVVEAATDGSLEIYDYGLATLIDNRLSAVEDRIGEESRAIVAMVVALLRMRLTPANEGGPYAPIWQADDQRSLLPNDLDEKQQQQAIEVARSIQHNTVKARLLDTAFVGGHWEVGRETVQAYNNEIRRIASGDFVRKFDDIDAPAMDVMSLLIRMTEIDRRITKGNRISDRSQTTIKTVCDLAFSKRDFFRYSEALEIGVLNRVLTRLDAANMARDLAKAGTSEDYPMAVKSCFEAAAGWFGEENRELRNDALLEAAKCSLAMAEQNPQPLAAAGWIKTAITEIRQVGGNEQWIASLKAQLRELQGRATEEVGTFSIKLTGLRGMRSKSRKYFSEVTLSEGLRQVAMHLWPSEVSKTKSTIDEISKNTIFDKIVSTSYMDEKGRTTSHGLDPNEHFGSDDYYKERAGRDLGVERRFQVVGLLEPAREELYRRYAITEHHMYPLIINSGFVPSDRAPIFAAGLAHLWQGNFLISSHLLVPQIENSLRHLLDIAGVDHATISSDGSEGDKSLSSLLKNFESELNSILTEEIVWELDLLFSFRPGSAFRHELSHGNLPYRAFYGDLGQICAWYCYFLVCVFTLKNWDRQVRPMYERGGWS